MGGQNQFWSKTGGRKPFSTSLFLTYYSERPNTISINVPASLIVARRAPLYALVPKCSFGCKL
jgi:hypothetical protein